MLVSDSIVDASAHQFSLHLAQTNYFAVILALTNIFQLCQMEFRKFARIYLRARLLTRINIALLCIFTILLYIVVRDYTYDFRPLLVLNR